MSLLLTSVMMATLGKTNTNLLVPSAFKRKMPASGTADSGMSTTMCIKLLQCANSSMSTYSSMLGGSPKVLLLLLLLFLLAMLKRYTTKLACCGSTTASWLGSWPEAAVTSSSASDNCNCHCTAVAASGVPQLLGLASVDV